MGQLSVLQPSGNGGGKSITKVLQDLFPDETNNIIALLGNKHVGANHGGQSARQALWYCFSEVADPAAEETLCKIHLLVPA